VDSNGQTEIRTGLQAGQKVVVSGQFLFDSEASLKASITRMSEMPAARATNVTHHGEGKVESIGKDEITISHSPIATLQWGPMTMGFKLPAGQPPGIAVGDIVTFEVRAKDGAFEITTIAPARSGGMAPPATGANASNARPDPSAMPSAKR
jgi:Cu(I)/Ag(I) efflux system membrane fusion protein